MMLSVDYIEPFPEAPGIVCDSDPRGAQVPGHISDFRAVCRYLVTEIH
jgi:hypothetical protein